jgi:hypothetical protein
VVVVVVVNVVGDGDGDELNDASSGRADGHEPICTHTSPGSESVGAAIAIRSCGTYGSCTAEGPQRGSRSRSRNEPEPASAPAPPGIGIGPGIGPDS